MQPSETENASAPKPLDRSWLIANQFVGFVPVATLRTDLDQLPDVPGVYALLNARNGTPVFLAANCGGWFKGKDPTVQEAELRSRWNPASQIAYIGKAGTASGRSTLRQRIRAYLDFGEGRPVGHWGGRLIWQLQDSSDLLVAWRTTKAVAARPTEKALLAEIENLTGRLPFANLRR